MSEKRAVKRAETAHQKRKVPPKSPETLRQGVTNKALRPRGEHLTLDEVNRLIDAARGLGRHGHRDATMLLTAFRHGLRVKELVEIRWGQIDFRAKRMLVNRAKNGTPSIQPIHPDELKALRKLKRAGADSDAFVFVTEREGDDDMPMSTDNVRKLVQRAGREAGLGDHVHPHQLRHAAGYALVNAGEDTRSIQGYLGHRAIRHTEVYTRLAEDRYKDFFAPKPRRG